MKRELLSKIVAFLICLASSIPVVPAQPETVVIRPVAIDDILVNPGMGIMTFQRFNGQAINPGKRWSEVGPEERLERAQTQPDFPDTSMAYFRWFWSQLEPAAGQYRWEIIDLALAEGRENGQQLQIRIMPYDRRNPLPEWYLKSGARRANRDSDEDGDVWSPDADDPLYLEHWSALVRAFGERYDGHPYLDTVDISSVGYWGEGWGPYLPSWETQKALIDIYFDAFQRTHLLMNFDEIRALSYGIQHGAGWRLDCWGDMGRPGRTFVHMLDSYPQGVVKANAQDTWRVAPVSLETCGTPAAWVDWGVDLEYVLDQALRWHASTINIKSTAIPEQWKDDFTEFQKKIGYRFLLRKLAYPANVAAGSMMPVEMWWFNAGVSPVYYEYQLALRLQSPAQSGVLDIPVDVREWLPGDALVEESLYVPHSLKPGNYRLQAALLSPRTAEPAIDLAIMGRQPDGWYDLGEIEVVAKIGR
jgi:hypothetical protein